MCFQFSEKNWKWRSNSIIFTVISHFLKRRLKIYIFSNNLPYKRFLNPQSWYEIGNVSCGGVLSANFRYIILSGLSPLSIWNGLLFVLFGEFIRLLEIVNYFLQSHYLSFSILFLINLHFLINGGKPRYLQFSNLVWLKTLKTIDPFPSYTILLRLSKWTN